MVSQLLECSACHLRFRTPTQRDSENRRFYSGNYAQGFTTQLPSDAELQSMLSDGFRGTDRHYGAVLEVLSALCDPDGARLFDCGCSWGYGSWQLTQAGFDVTACEIDPIRARYAAEKLGVKVVAPDALGEAVYDVYFSAHVIEHVTNPVEFVERAMRALKPGGIFVAITPNGDERFRLVEPLRFHRLWGRVHPQLVTPEWVAGLAGRRPYVIGSMPIPLEPLRTWANGQTIIGGCSGAELFFALRKT